MLPNRNERLRDATISLAFQSDEIVESLKKPIHDRLLAIHSSVAGGLELVRLSPRQAPQAVAQSVGSGLTRLVNDLLDTMRLYTQRVATAYPHFLTHSLGREDALDALIDPFDLDDLDGEGDSIFTAAAEFYGITEAEARELFEDFLIFGLLLSQWWEGWIVRQRVFLLQSLGSRLAEVGIGEEDFDVYGGRGLSSQQKAVVLGAVRESLVGNTPRSALATASAALSTHISGLTNAVIAETVQRNPEVFLLPLRWASILDSRVCSRCGALNGSIVDPSVGPIPPLHHLCRCVLVPVVEGEEAEWITFERWLKTRSPQTQDRILGKKIADAFRKGDVSIRTLVAMRNRVVPRLRTLGELGLS